VRRTSHGTINVSTNPGKTPGANLRKKPQPPPIEPDDDAATQIDPHQGKMRHPIEPDFFEVPDFSTPTPSVAKSPKHHAQELHAQTEADAATMVRGGTGGGKRTTGQFDKPEKIEKRQSGSYDKPGGQKLHRMSTTLAKVFQRRREQIGLSLEQVAKLSGINVQSLKSYEQTAGPDRLLYDHAVILSRVLGVRPQEMPGLRPREQKDDVPALVTELGRAILQGPVITFDGRNGERFGGDLERLNTAPAFALQINDSSLGDAWPKGSLLSFVSEQPQPGDVTMLRHRRSKLLAIRRLTPPTYNGLQPWQPAYVAAGEWMAIGRLQLVIPRLPKE
jgi:transcriptional regulator with XRE-family HTH domain